MTLKWLTLAEGLPATIIESNKPDNEAFLRTLFQNVCLVDVSQCEVLSEEQDSITLRIRGQCGTPEIGYRWERTKYIEDSSEDPMLITTYGLSGIQIRWSYSLWKSGYTYRFHHGWLKVAFADARAQEQFTQSWLQTFGLYPRFQES